MVLGDWGVLSIGASDVQRPGLGGTVGYRGSVSALDRDPHSQQHGGLPAGSVIQIGHADAAARPLPATPAPTVQQPRRREPGGAGAGDGGGEPPDRDHAEAGNHPTQARPGPESRPRTVQSRNPRTSRLRCPSRRRGSSPSRRSSRPSSRAGPTSSRSSAASSYGDTYGAIRRHGELPPRRRHLRRARPADRRGLGRHRLLGRSEQDRGQPALAARSAGQRLLLRPPLRVLDADLQRRARQGGAGGRFHGQHRRRRGTPPHLHFEVHPVSLLYLGYDGAIDPTPFLDEARRLQRLPFPIPPGWAPSASGGNAAPQPGAILLCRVRHLERGRARPRVAHACVRRARSRDRRTFGPRGSSCGRSSCSRRCCRRRSGR